MSIYEDILKTYLQALSEAPEACQNCERRHFSGCCGCSYEKYWDDKIRDGNKNDDPRKNQI